MKKIIISFIGLALFASCANEPKEQKTAENCTINFNTYKTKVGWTAYKTSAKIGVSGKFDQVSIKSEPGKSIEETMKGLEFIIKAKSVNTDNPERDNKIFNYFFNTMEMPGKIQGGILEAKDGKAKVMLTLNNVSRETAMTYTYENLQLEMSGTIDLKDWSAEGSMKTLNDQCFDLHKGEDGVSVLWPDVAINVSATLVQKCK